MVEAVAFEIPALILFSIINNSIATDNQITPVPPYPLQLLPNSAESAPPSLSLLRQGACWKSRRVPRHHPISRCLLFQMPMLGLYSDEAMAPDCPIQIRLMPC